MFCCHYSAYLISCNYLRLLFSFFYWAKQTIHLTININLEDDRTRLEMRHIAKCKNMQSAKFETQNIPVVWWVLHLKVFLYLFISPLNCLVLKGDRQSNLREALTC